MIDNNIKFYVSIIRLRSSHEKFNLMIIFMKVLMQKIRGDGGFLYSKVVGVLVVYFRI